MERDFLGLSSKEDDNTTEGLKDNSVFVRGSVMQWPFSNKVSALPQLMPYKSVQEDRSKKMVFDPLSPSGYADVFDSNHRTFNGGIQQRSFSFDRQGSNHYAMNAYPIQHVDTHSAQRSHDIRTFQVTNHTISVASTNPFFKNNVGSTGHNFGSGSMKQQPLGGIPVTTSHSIVPVVRSMVGTADQRNISKPTPASAQLTIFYGGTVNVYDDVSPEKAQAIMFLAGNGGSPNANTNTITNTVGSTNPTTPRTQLQPLPQRTLGGDVAHGNQSYASGLSSPLPQRTLGGDVAHGNQSYASGLSSPLPQRTLGGDVAHGNQSYASGLSSPLPPRTLGGDVGHGNQSYASGLSSPLSVTSLASAQSGSVSSGTDELMLAKPVGDLAASSSQTEPPKAVTMVPAAVPQARKASLARFLEKRKERVMITTPYNMNKKSTEGGITPGSNHNELSGNTEVRSVATSSKEQQSWGLGPSKNDRSSESLQTTLGF